MYHLVINNWKSNSNQLKQEKELICSGNWQVQEKDWLHLQLDSEHTLCNWYPRFLFHYSVIHAGFILSHYVLALSISALSRWQLQLQNFSGASLGSKYENAFGLPQNSWDLL